MPVASHRWSQLAFLVLALGLVGCSTAPAASTTPPQRRAANVAPQAASSPVVLTGGSAQKPAAPALASPRPQMSAPSLRLPSDGFQIVLVDETDGQGVWTRRQPGGEPIRVWPDGSPMLVVGEDRHVDGRTWRNVQTLDGEKGWAAADFLFPADPSALALAATTLSELPGGPRTGDANRPPPVQARVATNERAAAASPAPPTSTPKPVAQPAPKPAPANVSQPPAPAVPPPAAAAPAATAPPAATPIPSATPIRAPSGATSIAAGPMTMRVLGTERAVPIQIGSRPRPGMELTSVRIKVQNRDAAPFSLYRGSFKLALSDRNSAEPLAGGDTPIPYSASIAPGGELEGSLTFELPTGTRIDGLVWAPDRDVAYSLGI